MMSKPCFVARLLAATLCAAGLAGAAAAQDVQSFPSRPVKMVVPFPPGGATDAVARLVGQQLSALWKQPVIIDNKPGAGTVIGTEAVARAPGDGYTIGMVISAHTINPSLRPNLPYDTLKDFAAVSQVGVQHLVIAANPKLEADNIAELVALAKKNPGRITYASPGSGTAMHLAMELLNVTAGTQMTHVPYKGGAPAQQDVVGGQVPLLLDVYHSAAPLIKAGRLKPIALFSPKRVAAAGDIPTIAETLPGVAAVGTIGIVAPASTPKTLVAKMSADIAKAVQSREVSAKLAEMGVEPMGSTPEAHEQVIRSEINKWAPVVKTSGAKAD
jgi:tripartite-type tricarboxylate transporter receptor subunit TctC